MCRKSVFPIKAMPPARLMLRTILLALAFCASGIAQVAQPDNNVEQAVGRSASNVTASATTERVRFTSPNTVVQLRLEVYDEAGQKLLDTEQRGGNVLDWHLLDGTGQRVTDGVYLCVLTIKNLSGRLSQKLGRVTVSGQSTVVRPAGVAELGLRQAQTVGPVESEGEGLVVKSPEDAQPVTVLAHTGDEAQLARTRGALTFRVGDFFTGADKEQMRLTEEGNLGIGTAKPKARLDVAGMIRAREGFLFANGSALNVNDKGALTLTNSDGSVVPNAAGTGTLNQVAKWMETGGAGTLGNSTITELNGNVGIGTTSPSGQLHIFGTATQDVFAGMGPDLALGPAFNFGYAGGSFGRSAGFFNVRPDASAVAPNPSLRFATANVQRMIVTNTGDVGIGNLAPTAKLDVNGDINTSTQFNISGNRLLSTAGVKNLYAGVSTGPNTVTAGSCCNAFFGTLTGTANTTGRGNSFFGDEVGSANTTGSDNSFFGLGVGNKNINGSDNSFFGSQAGIANVAASGNSFFGSGAGNKSTGSSNSFFGNQAGSFNSSASQNSFFGAEAGISNTAGINNSFFGYQAGKANTTNAAVNNSFFGTFAGTSNMSGFDNSFFGEGAGASNTTGTNNSSLGFHADFTDGLTNATAIGFRSFVEQSNSLVLGSINGVNGASADTNVGIGTTAPARHLHVFGAGDQQIGIESSDTGGRQWTLQSSNGTSSGRFEIVDRTANANRLTILSTGNVGIGTTTPAKHLHIFGAGDQEIAIESSDSGGRQWTLQSSRGSSPFTGEFQIIDRTAGASRFSILGNGNVGIGTSAPATALHVVGGANGVAFAENHLVLIENTSPSFGIGTSTLAIKLTKRDNPDSQDNFITFIKGSGESAGSVEGNGSGGISFGGIGNDYAEWLPRLNSAEKIQPGEIVGLYGGHITKNTRGAAQVMAVSTGPIVAGNDPGTDARGKYALVAFIGQVMTRVRGSVQAGDFIVASGLNDGTGIAVSPANITAEQFEQVAGQAWETSADAGVKSVRIAVGLIRRDPTVRRLLEYSRNQADRIGALDARLTALEAQLTSKTARTSPPPVTRKKHRLVARLADAGTPRSVRTAAGTIR